MFYWIIKYICGPIVRFLWVESVEGAENIPEKGGIIIAANHASYIDFLMLPAICKRRIYFLSAEKFFNHPLWVILMKITGQIKVDREAKDKKDVYEAALRILSGGKVLGIFPEGTRSPDGNLQKAYLGVAKIALLSKAPILPIGISGAFKTLSKHDKLPKFRKVCKIKIGDPIYSSDLPLYEKNDVDVYCSITEHVMKKINMLIQNNSIKKR